MWTANLLTTTPTMSFNPKTHKSYVWCSNLLHARVCVRCAGDLSPFSCYIFLSRQIKQSVARLASLFRFLDKLGVCLEQRKLAGNSHRFGKNQYSSSNISTKGVLHFRTGFISLLSSLDNYIHELNGQATGSSKFVGRDCKST